VSLVLVGAVTLVGCGEEAEQRDLYASLEDCQKDWGRPEACEPAPRAAGTSHTGMWYGPHYAAGPAADGTTARGRHAVGSTRVTRGGFGSSSGLHSSGS